MRTPPDTAATAAHSPMLARVFVTDGLSKGQLRFIPLHQIAEIRLVDSTDPEQGVLVCLVNGTELTCTAQASVKRLMRSVGLNEHDLTLYSRRAKYWEMNLGDARYHLDRVAEALAI